MYFCEEKKTVDDCDYRLWLAWQFEFTIMYEKHQMFQNQELKATLLCAFSVVSLGLLVGISFSSLRTKRRLLSIRIKKFQECDIPNVQLSKSKIT